MTYERLLDSAAGTGWHAAYFEGLILAHDQSSLRNLQFSSIALQE